ncbi:hypothetical protein [Rhodovarius crocodyli]|uniref:hypothetical protein n=1 Tax=Rhodovarius crocodyli TaxID=1979269 RepID=UPI000FDB7DD7|nr:hypothetical protein [Rhodovarius crocodyli]
MVVTETMVRQGFPRCADPAAWAKALTAAFARFPAFTPLGAATIIAKAQVETGGLTRWDENLNYSKPEQLLRMHGSRAVRTESAKAALRARPAGGPWPDIALAEAREICGKPMACGDRVYAALGGYEARGGGIVQLTGLDNQQAFARYLGLTLAQARDHMRTIEGAALTGPWYVQHFGGQDAANRGDMREILRIVAGKRTQADLAAIWSSIHGDDQMAAFHRWRGLLEA